ncbi:hypothetical protein [Geomesophilobacter sediminis]|uniref:Uncharacterized protein n=1 Tax=Geomesophilobacter sediminis TaxID=2798584 RepID=A0A8J7IWW9_9BACT|nr:hypothetical protein [Geomesophilobacter sediminis]MBJ6724187.1 hypothetical protein [Geomesophilobacter sediminis]
MAFLPAAPHSQYFNSEHIPFFVIYAMVSTLVCISGSAENYSGNLMISFSDEMHAKITEALRLAAIYIHEHPCPDSPVRQVGEALELVTSCDPQGQMENRTAELEELLAEVLEAIYNEGTKFVPSLSLVDKMQRSLLLGKKIT